MYPSPNNNNVRKYTCAQKYIVNARAALACVRSVTQCVGIDILVYRLVRAVIKAVNYPNWMTVCTVI